MKISKDVDEYIVKAPEEIRNKLIKLREVIRITAPKAEERISYRMPYYGYKGRLVYFRFSKNHIVPYIPPPVIENYKKELKGYKTATATIQFPLDQKLPINLIKKLVKARIKINDETKIVKK